MPKFSQDLKVRYSYTTVTQELLSVCSFQSNLKAGWGCSENKIAATTFFEKWQPRAPTDQSKSLWKHQNLCYICIVFPSHHILNSLLDSGTLGYPTGVLEKLIYFSSGWKRIKSKSCLLSEYRCDYWIKDEYHFLWEYSKESSFIHSLKSNDVNSCLKRMVQNEVKRMMLKAFLKE